MVQPGAKTGRVLYRAGIRGALLACCAAALLGACAPPTQPSQESAGIAPTPTPAMPRMVVATFTPLPTPAADTGLPEAAAAGSQPGAMILRRHTVAEGDTLLGLALTYDVPMAAIQLQNDFGEGTIVQMGRVLEIPPPVGWEAASPFWTVYEVVEGDTLSDIAMAYGLDVAAMQGVNGLTNVDLLSLGQALILPLDAPAEVVAQASAPLPTPAPTPIPVPPTPVSEAPSPPETPATPAAPPPEPAPPPADVAAWPAEVFRLINEQRAAYGLLPLAWNDTLARAAQLHAGDCYARGWCSHTGSDGSTMKERIIREGYDPVRWSECWAWYGTPAAAVYAWMDEVPPNDPHRRTLLSTWLTEVGVGVAPGNSHGYYFIADFGRPGE